MRVPPGCGQETPNSDTVMEQKSVFSVSVRKPLSLIPGRKSEVGINK